MHEISLMRSVLNQVMQIALNNGGGTVRQIRLQCGALAGVEPALLESALEILRDEHGLADVELVIDEVPLEARCTTCQAVFHPQRFHFICMSCGSNKTEVIQGETLILESIELEPLAQGAIL